MLPAAGWAPHAVSRQASNSRPESHVPRPANPRHHTFRLDSEMGSEEQRQVLANTFTADLNDALKTKCRMTRRNGPAVARIRLALVDATTPNAALNTVAT